MPHGDKEKQRNRFYYKGNTWKKVLEKYCDKLYIAKYQNIKFIHVDIWNSHRVYKRKCSEFH